MAKFYVGQRVRKARGMCIGLTGTVAEIDPYDERGLCVEVDAAGVGLDILGRRKPFPRGALVWGPPDDHEPILTEGHRACDEEFKRDLDRLLERQEVAS